MSLIETFFSLLYKVGIHSKIENRGKLHLQQKRREYEKRWEYTNTLSQIYQNNSNTQNHPAVYYMKKVTIKRLNGNNDGNYFQPQYHIS